MPNTHIHLPRRLCRREHTSTAADSRTILADARALIGVSLLRLAGRSSDKCATAEGRGGTGESEGGGEESEEEVKVSIKETAHAYMKDRAAGSTDCQRDKESDGDAEEDKSRGKQRGTRRNTPMWS